MEPEGKVTHEATASGGDIDGVVASQPAKDAERYNFPDPGGIPIGAGPDPTAKPHLGKSLYEVRLPSPGRIVAYVISERESRPAIVVSTDGGTRANLRVFTAPGDGQYWSLPNFDQRNGAIWMPDVEVGTSIGTWHWPERA